MKALAEMSTARAAFLALLGCTLLVVSCAAVIERRAPRAAEAGPSIAGSEPVAPDPLAVRGLAIPVLGVGRDRLRDNYGELRGRRMHQAIDIMAPRGTPVVAADDGIIVKVRRHPLGGLSIHQYDPAREFAYYYAHLDRYAQGIREGLPVRRGDLLGYVGSTGNAPPGAPHLHFAVTRMDERKVWHRGTPLNPFPYFRDQD